MPRRRVTPASRPACSPRLSPTSPPAAPSTGRRSRLPGVSCGGGPRALAPAGGWAAGAERGSRAGRESPRGSRPA
eukprot:scaffold148_cov144-Isochrysis_galbana.AAC.2